MQWVINIWHNKFNKTKNRDLQTKPSHLKSKCSKKCVSCVNENLIIYTGSGDS